MVTRSIRCLKSNSVDRDIPGRFINVERSPHILNIAYQTIIANIRYRTTCDWKDQATISHYFPHQLIGHSSWTTVVIFTI